MEQNENGFASGVTYFILVYTDFNIVPISRLIEATTHMVQAFRPAAK